MKRHKTIKVRCSRILPLVYSQVARLSGPVRSCKCVTTECFQEKQQLTGQDARKLTDTANLMTGYGDFMGHPRQRRSSIESNTGTSVRSVANVRKSSASLMEACNDSDSVLALRMEESH